MLVPISNRRQSTVGVGAPGHSTVGVALTG
jgi:hypothetical protein